PIDQVPCEEYVIASPPSTQTFWLDTTEAHLIRRITRQLKGQVVDQTDITYGANDVVGWIPTRWTRNQYSTTGALLVETRVELLSIDINTSQANDQFEIDFPSGANVFDNKSGKTFVVRDGVLHEISMDHHEVAVTSTDWVKRHRWLLVATACV